MIGSRLLTGAGYTLKVPAIDLAEVGAGGGSHGLDRRRRRAADRAGERRRLCRARSATTRAATTPTVTDANVVLGYINPAHLVGGALKLNADKARAAFADKVAKPLGIALEKAAYGAHLIAASNMIRAIKAVSTERGRDPREFALFAFGGNGPLFAAGMATVARHEPRGGAAVGRAVLVVRPALCRRRAPLFAHLPPPAAPGRSRRDRARRGRRWPTRRRAQLAAEDFAADRMRLRRSAALHYQGQSYELTVPVPDGRDRCAHGRASRGGVRPGAREDLRPSRRHGRAGRAGLDPGRGPGPAPRWAWPAIPERLKPSRAEPQPPPPRRAYFGDAGWLETPIVRRSDLTGERRRPVHHRGIRRDLRRAARMPRRASTPPATSSSPCRNSSLPRQTGEGKHECAGRSLSAPLREAG